MKKVARKKHYEVRITNLELAKYVIRVLKGAGMVPFCRDPEARLSKGWRYLKVYDDDCFNILACSTVINIKDEKLKNELELLKVLNLPFPSELSEALFK